MEKISFGKTIEGQEVYLFVLKTSKMELAVSDYGSTLVNLIVKDKAGMPVDIALGYDDVAGYESDAGSYLGCNVGRNANRIANAKFVLNGVEYTLDKNDGENNLHSGFAPYSKRVWTVEAQTDSSITFGLESPHMDQGFPGNLKLLVTYKIMSEDTFGIFYEAVSDKDTIINLTNHSYFNLNGEGAGSILNHTVTLHGEYFTPTNANLIPTGEVVPVEGTPMDFRLEKMVGFEILEKYQPLILAGGYDHNWITGSDGKLHEIVVAKGDQSGITMTISTDYPGVQMYSGNFLDGISGKCGHRYDKREGICFEPQFYPNAVNQPEFISPVCKAGETYRKQIIYKFKV